MKLIKKSLGTLLTLILIASLMGCSTKTQKSQATPKTITKIVYKDRIIYKDKIIYKQTKKQRDDLQILIKIDNRMHDYFNIPEGNDNMRDYDYDKKMEQGKKTSYEFDVWYLEQTIKLNEGIPHPITDGEDKTIYKLTESQKEDFKNYKLIDAEIAKFAPSFMIDTSAHIDYNTHNLQQNEINFLKAYSKDFKKGFTEGGNWKY